MSIPVVACVEWRILVKRSGSWQSLRKRPIKGRAWAKAYSCSSKLGHSHSPPAWRWTLWRGSVRHNIKTGGSGSVMVNTKLGPVRGQVPNQVFEATSNLAVTHRVYRMWYRSPWRRRRFKGESREARDEGCIGKAGGVWRRCGLASWQARDIMWFWDNPPQ
jgi:hypothetical protein